MPPFTTRLPGATSISSPTFSLPCRRVPPITPPLRSLGAVPGELMSKERATCMTGAALRFLLAGSTMAFSIASMRRSMFTPRLAETRMIGAFSTTVPLTKSLISL